MTTNRVAVWYTVRMCELCDRERWEDDISRPVAVLYWLLMLPLLLWDWARERFR